MGRGEGGLFKVILKTGDMAPLINNFSSFLSVEIFTADFLVALFTFKIRATLVSGSSPS